MNANTLADLVGRIETWPEEAQEAALNALLSIEAELAEPYELTADDKAALDRSLDDMRNGRIAPEEQVATVFRRHRRT